MIIQDLSYLLGIIFYRFSLSRVWDYFVVWNFLLTVYIELDHGGQWQIDGRVGGLASVDGVVVAGSGQEG